ncbi:hypothetical protein IWX90DRAFT_234271 [Phyllosticta citrichinensis]|uniref:Uncharacterized protein n=1 Tax=Phyllosticta citrichinensis TaxID=1130410 RepID=A0ABR1XUY5_9PEZI
MTGEFDLTTVNGCIKASENQLNKNHKFTRLLNEYTQAHKDAKASIKEMRVKADKVEDWVEMAYKDLNILEDSITALRKIRRDAQSTEEDKIVNTFNLGAEYEVSRLCKMEVEKGRSLGEYALAEKIRSINEHEETFGDKVKAFHITSISYNRNVEDFCDKVRAIRESLVAAMEAGAHHPPALPVPSLESLKADHAMMEEHSATMAALVKPFQAKVCKTLLEAAILTGFIKKTFDFVSKRAKGYKDTLEKKKEQAKVEDKDPAHP